MKIKTWLHVSSFKKNAVYQTQTEHTYSVNERQIPGVIRQGLASKNSLPILYITKITDNQILAFAMYNV